VDEAEHATASTVLTRLTRGLLACVVVIGAFAFWVLVPLGWLHLSGELVSEPGPRFVLVIFACPLTMALVFVVLTWIDSYRRQLGDGGSQTEEGHSLLEYTLVISAVIAVVALVVWWAFIADVANPSGPLQPL